MRLRKLSRFVGQNIRRNRKNLVFSGIGILVGISSFVFFVALGSGVKRVVATEIFPQEANRINVVPSSAFYEGAGGKGAIDEEALERFSGLPGVVAVYPRIKLCVPATMVIDGRKFDEAEVDRISKLPGVTPQMIEAAKDLRVWMEIMADGVDPRLVKEDALFGKFEDPPGGGPIPVMISKRLVELYNTSFARTRGLPVINEILIPYVPEVPLTLNDSYVVRDISGPKLPVGLRLVGTSHQALLGGITMPLDSVRRLNRWFTGLDVPQGYDMAVLEVPSSDKLSGVQVAVREMGYAVDTSQRRMAESVGFVVTLVMLGFTLISLAMVAVAAVNIGHTFFMIITERKREVGLLRAVGATRRDVRSMILGEAAFVGAVGGVVGVLAGTAACLIVNWLAVRLLPEFPFKPDRFFSFPAWMLATGVIFGVVFCLAGAFAPANRAARLDPASTLSGH